MSSSLESWSKFTSVQLGYTVKLDAVPTPLRCLQSPLGSMVCVYACPLIRLDSFPISLASQLEAFRDSFATPLAEFFW